MRPRVLLVVNAEWYFLSHRLALAKALQAQGFEVVVAATVERGKRAAIDAEGLRFVPLHLQRRSTSPLRELGNVLELVRLYRAERPLLVHHLTIKPVLYGSLAAKLTRNRRVINTIPGLGYVFLPGGWRRRLLRVIVSTAYKAALSGAQTRVIFQNPSDREAFLQQGLVAPRYATLIRGSGVDIERFAPVSEPPEPPLIVLASRLLWDKGVGELYRAAQILRERNVQCRVALVGVPDGENPNAIPVETLKAWHADGAIEWWGLRSDMPDVLKAAHIIALPTYYPEGVPKILLEAASSGRPIIATDTPGCREIVKHGENGLLIPPRDPVALADALQQLVGDAALRACLGARGRSRAVTEFSEEQINRETLGVYRDLLGSDWPHHAPT